MRFRIILLITHMKLHIRNKLLFVSKNKEVIISPKPIVSLEEKEDTMSSKECTSYKLPFLTRFFKAISWDLKIPKRSESKTIIESDKKDESVI